MVRWTLSIPELRWQVIKFWLPLHRIHRIFDAHSFNLNFAITVSHAIILLQCFAMHDFTKVLRLSISKLFHQLKNVPATIAYNIRSTNFQAVIKALNFLKNFREFRTSSEFAISTFQASLGTWLVSKTWSNSTTIIFFFWYLEWEIFWSICFSKLSFYLGATIHHVRGNWGPRNKSTIL